MKKRLPKMFFVFEIITFEPVAVISPMYDDNICHLQ